MNNKDVIVLKTFSKKSTNDGETIKDIENLEKNTKRNFSEEKTNSKGKNLILENVKKEHSVTTNEKKLSILKYNLLGNKTYTYRRCLQEKILDKTTKSLIPIRKDFYGVEINDQKNHKIFFDLDQTKVIQIENWKKYNFESKHKKNSKCRIF